MGELENANAVIQRIAAIAHAVGWQAGVGGMDTAGAIVSYLANNPDQTATLLTEGVFATEHQLPEYPEQGCLTWVGMNGKVIAPETARAARLIKKMERGERL